MAKQAISNEIALRIGMAARVLPEVAPSDMMKLLVDAVGLPLNKKKLNAIDLPTLRGGDHSVLASAGEAALSEALAYLRGDRAVELAGDALPEVQPYRDGDMPGSIRIAVASNRGAELDGHFGSCLRFLIYQVSAQEARLIELREVPDANPGEDKNALRAELIGDCQVLFVVSVGGPAAAKVVRAGIHPIKVNLPKPAQAAVDEMRTVVAGHPPPWLAKVMGQAPEERARFAVEEEE